ncbi:TnsA-like heteromeric transposase endonuclease subunit [Kitasatospora aureofaciens]|uniref:TnsA-like heteromeric transposase endonuclease subunit n=1 Tax=Kitasatospora aureofaciens TaxID=1894 RepID=UPI0036F478EE
METSLDRLVVSEVLAGMPVREFRSYRGRRHYSGWYWAATTRGLVAYESRLELARILLADFDPSVVAIVAQPFQLVGADGSSVRRHVPDLLLARADGSVTVVDVKAAWRAKAPEVVAQFAWTEQVCATRGWAFETWYGADPVLVENVRFLAGYRRPEVIDQDIVGHAARAARTHRSVAAIERALASRFPSDLVRPAVLHLLWSGALTCDLNRLLGAWSEVRLTGEDT